jgi:hypothetical protein
MSRTPLKDVKDGDDVVPMHAQLFQFFSPRSRKIQVVSIGTDCLGLEVNVSEQTGCIVNIYDDRRYSHKTFQEALQVLTNRSTTPDQDEDWLKELANHWVKPENFVLHKTLPSIFTSMKENFPYDKIDILSINYPELECQFIYSILHHGYRPGILHVRWNEHPDSNVRSMLCAGHLQMCGYKLMAFHENAFFYLYGDECVYETTSWARVDCTNPALETYRTQLFESIASASASASQIGEKTEPLNKEKE